MCVCAWELLVVAIDVLQPPTHPTLYDTRPVKFKVCATRTLLLKPSVQPSGGRVPVSASVAALHHRPSWLPQAPPSLLHVVDPASCVSEGERSPGLQASSAHLDPAAQWRQCVSSGDKQQLLEYLQKGEVQLKWHDAGHASTTVCTASSFC